jgi:hypothetical protein
MVDILLAAAGGDLASREKFAANGRNTIASGRDR